MSREIYRVIILHISLLVDCAIFLNFLFCLFVCFKCFLFMFFLRSKRSHLIIIKSLVKQYFYTSLMFTDLESEGYCRNFWNDNEIEFSK